MRYTIVIEESPRNYAVSVPDLPGCVATGASEAEAVREISKAIRLHIESLRQHREPVPEPRCTATVVDVSDPSHTRSITLGYWSGPDDRNHVKYRFPRCELVYIPSDYHVEHHAKLGDSITLSGPAIEVAPPEISSTRPPSTALEEGRKALENRRTPGPSVATSVTLNYVSGPDKEKQKYVKYALPGCKVIYIPSDYLVSSMLKEPITVNGPAIGTPRRAGRR